MEAIAKLILPFFSTPKNYADVLTKLASFTFYQVYLITFLLRDNPIIEAAFTKAESWEPISKLVSKVPGYDTVNISGFVIAIILAVLTHIFHLHDRISDLLGLRRRFDLNEILLPLMKLVEFPVTDATREKLTQKRHEIMRKVFYKYASSGGGSTLVDKHDIEHALAARSWLWILVEGAFYFSVGALIAWWFGSNDLAAFFAFVVVTFICFAAIQRQRLGRYARPQVQAIASDPTARNSVKSVFDAL